MTRKYLSPKEAEEMTGIPAGTLANWRTYGRGPAYVHLGRLVRYPVADLEEWIGRQLVRTSGSVEMENNTNV